MREKKHCIRTQHEAVPAHPRQVRLCCYALILNPTDDWHNTTPRRCRPTAIAPSTEGRIPSSPTIRQATARSLPAITPTAITAKARWWQAPGILSVTVQTYIFKFKWNHKPNKAIFHLKYTKKQRDMKIFRQLFPDGFIDWQTIAHCVSISR